MRMRLYHDTWQISFTLKADPGCATAPGGAVLDFAWPLPWEQSASMGKDRGSCLYVMR
jgi:hypothetical protein